MTIKIPRLHRSDPAARIYSNEEIVEHQFEELFIYRNFMATLINTSNIINLSWGDNEDYFIRYYNKSVDVRFLTNCIMHSWYQGFWLRKSDLRRKAAHISEATFNRYLKYVIELNFIESQKLKNDKRQNILIPKKSFINICLKIHLERMNCMKNSISEIGNLFLETDEDEDFIIEVYKLSECLEKISTIISKRTEELFGWKN